VADGMTQVTAAPAGGLSSAEAADRLAGYGPNELPRARATPWWRLVADQVRDPLILVLLPGAVLVHDSKHRWRIFPDRVAALGGTGSDTAGPVNRQ
jgi:magnesium-transporting ATPase (P-type)